MCQMHFFREACKVLQEKNHLLRSAIIASLFLKTGQCEKVLQFFRLRNNVETNQANKSVPESKLRDIGIISLMHR